MVFRHNQFRTSIPTPTFMPAQIANNEHAIVLDSTLALARNEQKQACADKYAASADRPVCGFWQDE